MGRGRKKKPNSKNEIVHIRVDQKLNKSLENFCKECNVTKSEGVRLILQSMLK